MNNLEKFRELKEIAKNNNISIPQGTKLEDLKKILVEKNLLLKSSKEQKNQENLIEIPEEFQKLGIKPRKKKVLEEVELNNRFSSVNLFNLPKYIEDDLAKNEYRKEFPILKEQIEKCLDRGAEFILDKNGNPIKIYSGSCDEKGERLYHVALKIRKDIIEKEHELFRNKIGVGSKQKNQTQNKDNKLLEVKTPEGVSFYDNYKEER